MNQRIQQLALECGAWHQVYDQKRFMVDSNFDVERFAELLIRECAQEAYDCGKQFRNDKHYRADNLWPHFERVCNAVGDDIKIKFGVEE